MTKKIGMNVVVNGALHSVKVMPNVTLLDFLRENLKLFGSKECCAVGECGACTVEVNGKSVNACLMLAIEADGSEIRTIENLADSDHLNIVQDAFLEFGAVQCGFCIPGMVMSASQLLESNLDPNESEIREGLSGNLCRCGGYNRMIKAVKSAAKTIREGKSVAESKFVGGEVGNWKPVVGTDVRRSGGKERVTGQQQFLADIQLDGMLYVKLVSIDVGHAKIISIDAVEAQSMPGVVDIVSAGDLPNPYQRFGPVYQDRPILAINETKYHGEPVVAVVAETLEQAECAASKVKINYEELPGVYSIKDALDKELPLVQEPELRADDELAQTNILKERHYGWGDIEAATADVIIENRYTFPMVTHFAIEPHGFIVSAEEGELKIWSPVQHPYLLQRVMAELFELPLSSVRVFAPDPGGGFGGKQNPKLEPLLAHLSLRTSRPCRLVLTLEETFQSVRRAAADISIRTGFTKDGELVFQDIKSDYLVGAYADIAERVMTKGNYLACGPYRVPNVNIAARALLSHTTPSCAFRGFGTPQIVWAVESQMDAAARELDLDGLEIRLRNLVDKGEEVVRGDFPADGHWRQTMLLAADAIGWGKTLNPGRGRGIAVGIKSGATTGLSNSTIRLLADGSVILYAGTSDMGQGARTIFAQLAADALGVPFENVKVIMGDTDVVPFDLQTSASRSTVFMGSAIRKACEDIHQQLKELAEDLLGINESEITIANGRIYLPDQNLSIVEFVTSRLHKWNGELVGNGRYRKPFVKGHPLGGTPAFYEFNCTAFEVSVDDGTGEILIHKHVTAGDVGKALNPLQVEMQDEGAAIMGLGHSLMEQVILDDRGRIVNLGALDYRIPTSKDLPIQLEGLMVENCDGPGPYGSKGVSEGAILCTAPALSAAVSEASGVVITDLPMTPEKIWTALQTHCGDK